MLDIMDILFYIKVTSKLQTIYHTIFQFVTIRVPSVLIGWKYKYNKAYRLITVTLVGLLLMSVIISIFAYVYQQYTPINSYKQAFIYSASTYFNTTIIEICNWTHPDWLIIIEQLISLITNNVILAILTYNLFKTYNNVFLSKFLYVLKQEGSNNCYVFRFRLADVCNEFANYTYSIQFFECYKNRFKDTAATLKGEINELEYVYNEDIKLLRGKPTLKITEALARILSSEDTNLYAHDCICITISASSTKTSDSIIIRKYYGRQDIKFVKSCNDVFNWVNNPKDNKSPRNWININSYVEMSKDEENLIRDRIIRTLEKKVHK